MLHKPKNIYVGEKKPYEDKIRTYDLHLLLNTYSWILSGVNVSDFLCQILDV